MEIEHGISFYDIEFTVDQAEMDVAEDGTVLDIATVIVLSIRSITFDALRPAFA